MRGDQPVVRAASWMVSASTSQPYHDRVKVHQASPSLWEGDPGLRRGRSGVRRGLAGGEEDRLARLVAALVGAHDRQLHLGGALQAGEDLVEAHLVVAGPRLGDVDLRADAVRAAG